MPNLLDCTVTEILSEPTYKVITPGEPGDWVVKVKYDCYGVESENDLYFSTKEDADEVEVGYIFTTMF